MGSAIPTNNIPTRLAWSLGSMALAAIAVSCSSGSSRSVDFIQVVTQLPSVRQGPFDTPFQKTVLFGSFTGTNGRDNPSFRLAAAASFPKNVRIPSPSHSPPEGPYIIIISGRLNKSQNTIRDRSRAIEAVRRYLGPSEAMTIPAVVQLVRLRAEFERAGIIVYPTSWGKLWW